MRSLPDLEPSRTAGSRFWASSPATDEAVSGSRENSYLTRVESLTSRLFLLRVCPWLCNVDCILNEQSQEKTRKTYAADVGAGIGRVSVNVLLHFCDMVDVIEPIPHLLDAAKESLTKYKSSTQKTNFFLNSIQDFDFKVRQNTYDVIWCQWFLGHVKDTRLVSLLKLCQLSLTDRGMIIIKENLSDGETYLDSKDSALCRSEHHWLAIFRDAKLKVIRSEKQKGLPSGLLQVTIWALR